MCGSAGVWCGGHDVAQPLVRACKRLGRGMLPPAHVNHLLLVCRRRWCWRGLVQASRCASFPTDTWVSLCTLLC